MKTNLYILKVMVVLMGMILPSTITAAYIAVSAGNWSNPVTWGGVAPPTAVSNEDITIPDGMTVNLDQDVTFTSTTGTHLFLINGTLSNTSEKGLTVVSGALSGDGVVAVKWMHFKQLATSSFSGLMNVKNFTNEATMLNIAHTLNISDTLYVRSGMIRVEPNGVMTIHINSTYKADNGAVTVDGGVFDRSYPYDVMYVGSSKTTGIELNTNTLRRLIIKMDNEQTVTLNKDTIIVHGEMVMSSGNLLLNGKRLKLHGTLTQHESSRFRGDANSELYLKLTSVTNDTLFFEATGAANHSLKKLVVNTSGTGTVVLGSQLNIGSALNFVSGKLELANNDLVIMPGASVAGYSDARYVITSENASGNLVMNVITGSPYTTFPVGTSSNYSPAYIEQSVAGTTGDFSVRSMNTVLENGTSGFVSSSISKVVDRTWFISSTAATIDAGIKLGWTTDAEVNGFDRTNAYITHYTSSAWDQATSDGALAGENNTYELTRSGITSLSPFAVIESWEAVKINEVSQNNDFEVYPNPSKDLLTIKMLNPSDHYKYELIDLTGRTVISDNNRNSNKFNLSDLETGCYIVKVTNLNSNAVFTKRIIKE